MAVTTPTRPAGLTDYQWEQYKNRLMASQPKPTVSTAPKVATVPTTAVKTPITPISPAKPVVQTVKPTAPAPQKENVTLPGGTVTEVVRPKDLSDQQWQQYKDRLSGKTASDTQKRVIDLQEQQITGKMSYDQAAENRKNEMIKSLSSNPFVTPQYLELFKQKWNAKTGQLEGVSDEELANIPRRDFAAEQQMMNELGITKEDVMKDENTRRLLFQATYSPDQLQAFGYNWAFDGGAQTGQAAGGGAVGPGGTMTGGAVGGVTGPGGTPAIGGVAQPPIYNPEVLRQMGLSEEQIAALGQAGGAANAAQGSLASTPKPTNSSLGVLQEALNLKSNVTNQELGKSKLFEAANLSGYASLGQSLAQKGREQGDRYNSFRRTVGDTAGAMVDVYNAAMDGYKTAMDVYDKQVAGMQEANDKMMEWNHTLDLLERQTQIDKDMAVFNAELAAKYPSPSESKLQLHFNPLTGEEVVFDPVTGQRMTPGGQNYTDSDVTGYYEDGGEIYDAGALNDVMGVGSTGGWCGVYASTISTAPKVGNSWTEKKQRINLNGTGVDPNNSSTWPTPGSKLLLPLGVSTDKNTGESSGYGHVAVVTSFDPQTGEIQVVESNKDGRMGNGDGPPGVVTVGSYNLNQLNNSYGNNWGFALGEFKPEIKKKLGNAKVVSDAGSSTTEILRKAKANGYNIEDPKIKANVLMNAKNGIPISMEPELAKQLDGDKEIQRIRGQNDMLRSIEAYQKILSSIPDNAEFNTFGDKKAVIDAAYNELALKYKNYQELGVLAGPDMGIIQGALKPISGGPGEAWSFLTSGGVKGAKTALDYALTQLKSTKDQSFADVSSRYSGLADSDYFNLLRNGGTKNASNSSSASGGKIDVNAALKANKSPKQIIDFAISKGILDGTARQYYSDDELLSILK